VIRHVSVFTFVADATNVQVQAVVDALATLRARLRAKEYSFGPDLGLNDGNASFVVVADFETVDDYHAYLDDPEHQRILAELIRPILASRTAVQYEVGES
jgi:stress responsive alpha/beta barrel protein